MTATAKIRILWSKHARERLRTRGASRAQCLTLIRRALEAGELEPGTTTRLSSGGLRLAVARNSRRSVSVITVIVRGRRRNANAPAGPKLRAMKARWQTNEEE